MLLKLTAFGALGLLGYRFYQKQKEQGNAAFAAGQADPANPTPVRDAGPAAMADPPERKWTKADEESDESFPASDPPANY